MNLSTRNTSDTSLILIESELFDATIGGHYKLSALPESFEAWPTNLLTSSGGQDLANRYIQSFHYHIDLKRVNPILDFFYPTFN